jgi:pimeloyl-ACP methyl ester carboxylesterase
VAPPESLRACVLVDGGYMSLGARMKLGAPVFADRNAAIEFARAAVSEHGSWEEAFAELRTYFENWTPAAELATRDAFREVDGRIRESASVEGSAAMLFALRGHDPVRRAREIAVPTLLIVNGRPDGRAVRAPEWERFAAASPLVDLHVGDDWGHHPFQQAPEESGRVVGDWLRAHL